MFIEQEEDLQDRAHEPQELRNLSKKTIWKNLNIRFFMPDPKSRINTRRYLAGCHLMIFLTVERVQLLQFEANLTLEDRLKSGDHSVPSLVETLDNFLQEQSLLPLGSEES